MKRSIFRGLSKLVRMTLRSTNARRVAATSVAYGDSPELVARALRWVRGVVWPEGVLLTPAPPPTDDERAAQAAVVFVFLRDSAPGALTSIVGVAPAEHAALKVYEFLQNPVLLRSFAYSLLDLIIIEAFPDLQFTLDGTSHLK